MNFHFFFRFMVALLLLGCITTSSLAAEVVLENNQIVVKNVENNTCLAVCGVVLSYGSEVTINSVNFVSPFMGASNILNSEGTTIIAAIQTTDQSLNEDVPVAFVDCDDCDDIEIFVRDLADINGVSIPYNTQKYTGSIPKSTGDSSSYSEPSQNSIPEFLMSAGASNNSSIIENTGLTLENINNGSIKSDSSASTASNVPEGNNNDTSRTEDRIHKIPISFLCTVNSLGIAYLVKRKKSRSQ